MVMSCCVEVFACFPLILVHIVCFHHGSCLHSRSFSDDSSSQEKVFSTKLACQCWPTTILTWSRKQYLPSFGRIVEIGNLTERTAFKVAVKLVIEQYTAITVFKVESCVSDHICDVSLGADMENVVFKLSLRILNKVVIIR